MIGTHDKTSFFKLFESGHHRNTDEDPLSSRGFCALSRSMGRFVKSISAMVFSNSECSLYAVFDVEESR